MVDRPTKDGRTTEMPFLFAHLVNLRAHVSSTSCHDYSTRTQEICCKILRLIKF